MTKKASPELPGDDDPVWQYYFVYWAGDSRDNPRGVVRRCTDDAILAEDCFFGRDGGWHPTPVIALHEIGRSDEDVEPTTAENAWAKIARWRSG